MEIKDFSGGLNKRDPRSALPLNQVSEAANLLFDEKGLLVERGGQQSLQSQQIGDAVFAADANTIALWHLDESVGSICADATGNFDLTNQFAPGLSPVPGLFGNAQKFTPVVTYGDRNLFLERSVIYTTFNGLSEICVEGRIKIDPTFSGRPVLVTNAGVTYDVGNDDSPIFTSVYQGLDASGNVITIYPLEMNVKRDWDVLNNIDVSDPYVTFSFQVAGFSGAQTILKSPGLPRGKWIHVRAEYSSITGFADLYINGRRVQRATPIGGGTLVVGSVTYPFAAISIGSKKPQNIQRLGAKNFNGAIDEVRISSVVRGPNNFPFKKPDSKGMNLEKANGTVQMVASAQGSLYYTIGDGNWTLITSTDPTTGLPLSLTAQWSGVQIGDRLYMTNGINTPLTWDGQRLVPTGEAVNSLILSASAGGSTHTNGLFQYVYTYKYGTLDETGFSPVSSITVSGNKDVNIDGMISRMSNATSIRIYRTKAGGTQYFLLREITNNAGVINMPALSGLWTNGGSPTADAGADGVPDGSTPTNLNDDADYALADSVVAATHIPKPKYYLAAVNRLMGAGMQDREHDLVISALGNPDVFRPSSFASVPTDKGFIVAIYQYYGEVHISLNARATNVLSGTDESNWVLTTNLHPDVGARDHWSIAQRYPVGDAGRYILVFAGPDGEYQYAGQNITKISDQINPVFDNFSFRNSLLESWLTTEQADFQAAKNFGGSVTPNVQADAYETDGLRQNTGNLEIVDQLNYIGLYKFGNQPWVGSVIAICKAPAEGEFYFSTDGNNSLYHTTDNFQTAAVVASTANVPERIIEIVKRGVDDFYFLLTDTANVDPTNLSSAGGPSYAYVLASNVIILLNATPLFYDLDVPIRLVGVNGFNGNFKIIGYDANEPTLVRPNLFCNHAQKIAVNASFTNQWNFGITKNSSISGPGPFYYALSNIHVSQVLVDLVPGFFAFDANSPTFLGVDYSRREFPLWRGGTFRPQAYWDVTNNRLVFLASSVETQGQRNTYLQTLTSDGVLTIQSAQTRVSAFTTDGVNIYYTSSQEPANNGSGFVTNIYKATLAAPSVVISTGANISNTFPTRLSYNTNALNGTYIGLFKSFGITYVPETSTAGQSSSADGRQDFWTYTGTIQNITTTSSIPSWTEALAPNGDSGPYFNEVAVQTTTPFAWYAVVDRLASDNETAIYSVDAVAIAPVAEQNPYISPYSGNPVTGISCNLLFVPASGITGSYSWADRLYWMANAASVLDTRLLQFGVAGTWQVQGSFTSMQNNLGLFNAFGSFSTDFIGQIAFFMRNAATAGALAASELAVATNDTISQFPSPAAWAQWRVQMTWSYTVATPTQTPSIKDVLIDYFVGVAFSPRPVGIHWAGRTYFAYASNGAPENDTVVVYDKGNAFTLYTGWNITAFMIFRGMLCAFQDYEFVQLEVGFTDLGARIMPMVRTGVITGENTASIQEVKANVQGSQSSYYPNANGYVEIVPMAGDDEIGGNWVLPLPPSRTKESRRVQGIPVPAFQWAWGQAYSLIIQASEQDPSTGFAALSDQQMNISQIDVSLVAQAQGRNYTGK